MKYTKTTAKAYAKQHFIGVCAATPMPMLADGTIDVIASGHDPRGPSAPSIWKKLASAPPAMPANNAIQPVLRPITSTTMMRLCDCAVVCSRSIASVANATAVSNPKVTSVALSPDGRHAVAAAAKGSMLLLILGLAISIPLVIFGSTMLMKVMDTQLGVLESSLAEFGIDLFGPDRCMVETNYPVEKMGIGTAALASLLNPDLFAASPAGGGDGVTARSGVVRATCRAGCRQPAGDDREN